MSKVLYAKFSNQRKKELQISTTIVLGDDGKKYVDKKALTSTGEVHLKHMMQYYNEMSNVFSQIGISVIKGKQISDQLIRFPFLRGKSFEVILAQYVEKENYLAAKELIQQLFSSILSNKNTKIFTPSEEFYSIFGDVSLEKFQLHSFDYSNVDMVFSNFIVETGKCTLIDYEWVFPFQVPLEFVFFRSLFHSIEFQKMPDEDQQNIYEAFRINDDLKCIFTAMEFSFQRYTKGAYSDLNDVYEKIDNKATRLSEIGEKTVSYKVYVGDVCQKVGRTLQSDIKIKLHLNGEKGDIRLLLNNLNGIYKIKSFQGTKDNQLQKLRIIRDNASLKICDDYYFVSMNPELVFANDGYDEVIVEYSAVVIDNVLMPNLLNALIEGEHNKQTYQLEKQKSQELEKNLEQYKKESEDYRKAYETCSNMLKQYQNSAEEYRIAYNTVSQELNEIHQTMWWKINHKLKSARKEK